ncbi:MAG: hypothetical protein WAN76_22315 [Candidatus Sulfotelmatobacter sp.]
MFVILSGVRILRSEGPTQSRRFILAQLLIGTLLTLFLTYLGMAISDRPTTPQLVRWVISPGFVLGVRFASGDGFLETLGSFGRIAITANVIYYSFLGFLVFRKINWPKLPRNPNHRFWMER